MTVSCWVNMKYANALTRESGILGSKMKKISLIQYAYMYLLADGNNEGHKGYTAALTNSGWGDEKGARKRKPLANDQDLYNRNFDGSEKEMFSL